MVESTCNAGATGDASLIPGSGRSPGEVNDTHPSILVWRIQWTEEPGWVHEVLTSWTQLTD